MKKRNLSFAFTSLAIFVIILIGTVGYFILSDPIYKVEHCVQLAFLKNNGLNLNGGTLSKMRQYKSYVLTNDPGENRKILTQVKKDLNTIAFNSDTIHGIDIVLNDESTYQDFIFCIDACREKSLRAYVAYENHIYGLYVPIDTSRIGIRMPCK